MSNAEIKTKATEVTVADFIAAIPEARRREEAEAIDEADIQYTRSNRRKSDLPARQQDMIFPRARDRRTSTALASYLTTAGFTDWDMEVLGLDLYI